MTIKEAQAVRQLFTGIPDIILAMAYDQGGKPLIKPIQQLLNAANKKAVKYPKYFKKIQQ